MKSPTVKRDYKPGYQRINDADKFIRDAAAFLRHNITWAGTWDEKMILATLVHDIMGLAENERCFLPRVSGYADRESK